MDWQPIATAPRDGSWFLTVNAHEQAEYEVGCYDPYRAWSYVDAGDGLFRREQITVTEWRGFDNFHRATHWCGPLSPPSTKE